MKNSLYLEVLPTGKILKKFNMTKDNSIGELLEKLNSELKNPKDSVHKIVLQTTIDNINKLLDIDLPKK